MNAPRLLVNEERTILVTLEMEGNTITSSTIAFRDHPSHTWGPPFLLVDAEREKRLAQERQS